MSPTVSRQDILDAARRIAGDIHVTPVVTCRTLALRLGRGTALFLKCENFQRTGSFKARGASNAVRSLPAEAVRRGVLTHSSGNHAAALAHAAARIGVPAHVVMPANASPAKIAAARHYGARITLCDPTLEARETTAARLLDETGAAFVHPYDDPRIIAGQGTATLEFLRQTSGLDLLVAPVGGGGLLSGTVLAAAAEGSAGAPAPMVCGAEPAVAPDAREGLRTGNRLPPFEAVTMADGLRTALGELPFSILRGKVHDVITASEAGIREATRALFTFAKLVVEPSAAVPLAALIESGLDLAGRRVGVILSGGNLDLDAFFKPPPTAPPDASATGTHPAAQS